MQQESWILLAIGVVQVLLGIFKIGFNRRRTQRMVKFLGEGGTQLFYIIIGIIIIVVAIVVNFL